MGDNVYGYTSMRDNYGYESSSDSSFFEEDSPPKLYCGKDIILSPSARMCINAPYWYEDGKDLSLSAHTWYVLLTALRPFTLIHESSLGRFFSLKNISSEDEKTLRKFRAEKRQLIPVRVPKRCLFVNWLGRRCDFNTYADRDYCTSHDPNKRVPPQPLPENITEEVEEFKDLVQTT